MERTAGWTSSTEPGDPGAPRRVVVGRVRGAHGLRGRVRVQCFGDAAEMLSGLERIRVGLSEDDPGAVAYGVESAKPGRGDDEVRMSLDGIGRREQAEALRGLLVMADAEQFEALPPGEYWAFQLVGCRVESPAGAPLGQVRSVWHTAAQPLLVVVDAAGREQMIPAVGEMLRQVDLADRRIVVELPAGLLEED